MLLLIIVVSIKGNEEEEFCLTEISSEVSNVLNYQTQVLNASMNNIAEILRAKLGNAEEHHMKQEMLESLQNVGAIKQTLDSFKSSMQELRVKVILIMYIVA